MNERTVFSMKKKISEKGYKHLRFSNFSLSPSHILGISFLWVSRHLKIIFFAFLSFPTHYGSCINGNSKIGAHVRSYHCYLMCFRHLIRSREDTNPIFIFGKDILSFIVAQHVLSYHLIYEPFSAQLAATFKDWLGEGKRKKWRVKNRLIPFECWKE